MPEHKVQINLAEVELNSAPTTIRIKADNKTIGTIHISQGRFEYQPVNWQRRIKFSWQQLDKYLREYIK